MARWFGFTTDSTAGGMSLDDLVAAAGTFPAPDTWVPVTTAQVEDGEATLERNDEVRGRRGNTRPHSFSASPSVSFGARAYPELFRSMLRKALGGTVTTTGTAPAALSSSVERLESGNLPPIVAYLMREEQVDRLTGCVVEEFSCEFPIDGEGTVTVNLPALYRQTDPANAVSAAPGANAYQAYDDVYALRDAVAILGDGVGTQIDCLAGFQMTINNGLYTDARSRFCAGKNIRASVVDTIEHRVWYPERHKIGPQRITGRLDFGVNRPDLEVRKLLRHAEKLVVELAAGPLGTTPAADEMLRLTFHHQVPVGGGPEPLQDDGDQVASYEFEAFIHPTTGKDLTAEFVGTSAVV